MKKIWLTTETVASITSGSPLVSLDLGKTFQKPDKKLLTKIPVSEIKGNFIFCWDGRNLYKLAIFHNNFYRLRLWNGIPLLEIDGIRMHLVKDFETPIDYSRRVVQRLHIHSYDTVLDSCGGLGYTAIAAATLGATVFSYEISKEVLTLAKWNPWSEEYFSSQNISLKNADVSSAIKKLKDNQFSVIIHDPPSMKKAGALYSADFYKELHRVAKAGCRLFHYVGSTGKTRRGRNIEKEVKKRLIRTGWRIFSYSPSLQGLFAVREG